jgi:hypothetical protein
VWQRRRTSGARYCRRCLTVAQARRHCGLSPLSPLPSLRKRLSKEAFSLRCLQLKKQKKIVFELAGLNENCLGAAYRKGLGPKKRALLCEVLRVREDQIFMMDYLRCL